MHPASPCLRGTIFSAEDMELVMTVAKAMSITEITSIKICIYFIEFLYGGVHTAEFRNLRSVSVQEFHSSPEWRLARFIYLEMNSQKE